MNFQSFGLESRRTICPSRGMATELARHAIQNVAVYGPVDCEIRSTQTPRREKGQKV